MTHKEKRRLKTQNHLTHLPIKTLYRLINANKMQDPGTLIFQTDVIEEIMKREKWTF